MQSDIARLCIQYEYPPLIETVLSAIINPLSERFVHALLLIGSTSRGEMSWIRHQTGATEILSDIEFLLIVNPHSNVQEATEEYRRRWDSIEVTVQKESPLFHIDSAMITLGQLRHLPRLIRTFEAGATGKVLFGHQVISHIPEVNIHNLDFRELNEVLLWRLWAILLFLRPSFVFGSWHLSPDEERASYLVARNGLDLTTWALPYEGILLAGFRPRINHIQRKFDTLTVCRNLDSDFPYWLSVYERAKFNYQFRHSWVEIYDRVILQIENAFQHLSQQQNIESPKAFLHASKHWFTDTTTRGRIRQLRLWMRQPARNLLFFPRFTHSQYGACVFAMLRIHRSAIEWLQGNDRYASDLLASGAESIEYVWGRGAIYSPVTKRDGAAQFPERWQFLRSKVAKILMSLNPTLQSRKPQIDRQILRM